MDNKITTKQYASINIKIYKVRLKGLEELLTETEDTFDRDMIEAEIVNVKDWIEHYEEMLSSVSK
jgi:hypothetical protein